MDHVATLVGDPDRLSVTPAVINAAARALGASHVHELAQGIACDIALPPDRDTKAAQAVIEAAIAGAEIDVFVQPATGRRKQVLIADMDSTMIKQECIDQLADACGAGALVSAITEQAMNGQIGFADAVRERVNYFSDQPAAIIDEVLATRISLTKGARTLVATMRANGAYAELVSGGFVEFAANIAEQLGFDAFRANVLEQQNGRLTGKVVEPILGRDAKAIALREIVTRLDLSVDDVMAVGDGANDLEMLSLAGAGVAFHAKDVVAGSAQFRVDHGDLTALLYLQGYTREEFVDV